MGNKRILSPFYQMMWGSVITGPYSANTGAMASTNTIYTRPQNVENFDNIAIQFSWTGTPTGTIVVSESVDGVIWDDLILDPVITQPAGGASHWSVNLIQMPAPWIQVRYTNASGTGVLTAKIFSKDLN